MSEEHATAMVQRYVNELGGDSPAEPIVRDLLDRAVRRLHLLCATLLHRGYQGLTQVGAAELLVVRAVTVKRRLSRDVWLLTDQLAELRPGGKPPDAI